jgi:hypothetical protein
VGLPTLDALLRTVATPELYLRNAFRIAGLPVDATTGDLRRRAQELRAVRILGGGGGGITRGPLPPVPPADPEAVTQALARLRDPLARLVDEFFWFWPGPQPDPALDALTAGRIDDAEHGWRVLAGSTRPVGDPAAAARAEHNLAVLHHAIALDDERTGPPRRTAGAPRRWREAYRYWIAVWRSDAFWELFAQRVYRIGHPGLAAWTAPTFRDRLPLVLASVNAAIAADGLERGRDEESTAVHWRMVGHQDLPPGVRARAVRAATDPIIARVDTHCTRAMAVTGEDPANAPGAARRLHEQTALLLRMVSLSGAPDADGVSDKVAQQLLRCAYEYHRATNDWRETLGILRLAQDAARGTSVLNTVRDNVRGVEYMLAREGDLEEQRRRQEREERANELRRRRAEEERVQREHRERMRQAAIEAYERRRAEEEHR